MPTIPSENFAGDGVEKEGALEIDRLSAIPASEVLPDPGPVVAESEEEEHEDPELPFSKARCIALVATLAGAGFMNTLSTQATVIILPTIGRDLQIPDSRLQWIISAYSLTFGTFLLIWGRIADIVGKRDIFIWGSAFVAAVSIANPFIPNEIAFDLFRGLQGLGAAANVPTAIGIITVTFPPGKAKNYAISAYASSGPLGSISGNLLAGFLSSAVSWKWVFGVLGGFGVAVTAAGYVIIPLPQATLTPSKKGIALLKEVDWIGGALITLGALALLFALTEGNVIGWKTAWIYVLIVVSLILIGIFAAWQWYQESRLARKPLMKVSIFKNLRFCAAMVFIAIFFATFNNFLVFTTYFFQDYQGLGTLQTTLRFIPTGVTGAVVALIISRLISRVPTWILLACGNTSISIACLLYAVPIPVGTSYFAYGLPAFILSVIGIDTAWPCLILFTSKSLPQEDQAVGGALVNSLAQIGRAIGLAIATAIQTAVMAAHSDKSVQDSSKITPHNPASLAGLRAAYWFNFALGILCLIFVCVTFRGTGIVGERAKPKKVSDA
ncbi:major facilitator superfamily transporter [Xylariaceae sp. FL0255]|nr:major facilitator superfamily transporter [Xylariaceae sp. FL0255]